MIVLGDGGGAGSGVRRLARTGARDMHPHMHPGWDASGPGGRAYFRESRPQAGVTGM